MVDQEVETFFWEPTYEIVRRLMARYPDADIEAIGLHELREMIIALPGFADEPSIASDELISDILREWYEEASS